jgi:hypothetical protein
MFQALVLACMVFQPTVCWQLEDQLGPYKTYEKCEARALEMGRAVHIHMAGYRPVSWKCQALPKGRLST